MSDNIISFTDYLKKRNKPLQIDPGFIEALGDDIKNRPELLEWFRFQTTFHHHKLFLHSLFTANRGEPRNPNAAYFMCFDEKQVAQNTAKVLEALQWLGRSFIHIEAKDCTFGDMAAKLSGIKPGSKRDAWDMFKEVLLGSDKVIIVSNLSQSKIPSRKSSQARSLIKINDDAHFDGIKPRSDLVFVDYAAFLQRSWSELGPYLEVFT
jgi:hypothetical protein